MKNENDQSIFIGIYIFLGALKHGFLDGCQPVLSTNCCFIKGPWKGQILVVVGRYGSNQMHPITWAVTRRENISTWCWFVKMLSSDFQLGDGTDGP